MKAVYRAYQKYSCDEHLQPVEFTTFRDVFNEENISIFVPRKDQCDTCVSYHQKQPNVSEEDYKKHQLQKEEAREAQAEDIHNTSACQNVFCMDAQSVLLCPVTKASAMYYRTKLAVHNYTVYDSRTNTGYCYLWDESEGDLSANVFASILRKFLEEKVALHEGDVVVLWSDGCGYQNRNVTLTNALFDLARKRKVIIIQKFLEKGHTQMKCDSMHSVIERKIRGKDIYLPSSYATLCRDACRRKPYEVQYLHHDDFSDFTTSVCMVKTIRPGKKAGDPVVVDLRALKYDGQLNQISYKLRHLESWQPFSNRLSLTSSTTISPLFTNRLPITKRKHDDLIAMLPVLPRDTHDFYRNLISQ